MKLYFMKQNAIDYLKANMKSLYMNFYRYNSNEWLYDLFEYDPFELFMEVPDFELAPIGDSPGETELNNCKILYTNLKRLSPSQASDERLWAGLCNGIFYSYVRRRWNYGSMRQKQPDTDAASIVSRFFYSGGGRNGMFRNTLSKCWWVGQITYIDGIQNHWKQLDILGPEDFATKVSDIFRNNNFIFNPEILDGFCKGLDFFKKRNQKLTTREHMRPTLQYLNALGGAVLLDELSSDDISTIVIENIGRIINGDQADFFEEKMETSDSTDSDELTPDNDVEINMDYQEEQEAKELENEGIDPNVILGKPTEVQRGCTVVVLNTSNNKEILYNIPTENGERELYGIEKQMLGKQVGDTVRLRITDYEILSIRW